MHAAFIRCRPSFPLGFRIGNLPPVQRPLHSDESIETYLLDRTEDSEVVLIRSWEQQMKDSRDWWRICGHDVVIEISDDGKPGRVSAIRIRGEWWPEKQIESIAESQWETIVLTTVTALKKGYESSLCPEFKPSLTWFCRKTLSLLPLFAVPAADITERELLVGLAGVLISGSTGVEFAEVVTGNRALKSWNKRIPSNLFDALVRCLPNQGDDQIADFAEFEERIAGNCRTSMAVPSQSRQVSESEGLTMVAGMDDLKEWLQREVIAPLQNPDLYQKYRIGIPNGILFYGPPGCGKTHIARRLAEEIGYHFEEIKPSDVASPYIHSTVIRIRELFEAAIEKAPAVVFIDEFDAFVPSRSELGGHQQYKAEEVNEFLANLEGIANRKVLVIAATNEPEKIDPAVRRSGRFDKLVFIPPPDAKARAAMLQHHLAGRPLVSELDVSGIGIVLDGYSASDLKLLVDEAARIALHLHGPISTETLLSAMQRVPPSISSEDRERYRSFRTRGL